MRLQNKGTEGVATNAFDFILFFKIINSKYIYLKFGILSWWLWMKNRWGLMKTYLASLEKIWKQYLFGNLIKIDVERVQFGQFDVKGIRKLVCGKLL